MQRVIVPTERFYSEALSDGVFLERFYPGGKDGPNGEVLADFPGGRGWTDFIVVGDGSQPFQLGLPDIRLPANQYWPLHWHDCWTVVMPLEGQCCAGDWWLEPGDVLVVAPGIEYGPLLIGPQGCRLFEIFARAHLAPGGYSPEYRDHPTLQGTQQNFVERSAVNKRNDGRQVQPCDGVDGIIKGHLTDGAEWDLGESGDPDRGLMKCTHLSPNESVPPHVYGDWHAIVPLGGGFQIDGRTVAHDDYLLIQPNSLVGEIKAGPEGARLFEIARTSGGMERAQV